MAKSTWWIGLSSDWKIIERTSYSELRPDINVAVHMWIKKQETDGFLDGIGGKKRIVYDYTIWDRSFRKRQMFPINDWDIVGISASNSKSPDKLHIHLQDPFQQVKNLIVESDNNWHLTDIFSKIDFHISNFENWADYERHML